ncbi:ABC transporter ATP-binding protein [Stutzerimonas degradans]|nr:ABC transporter ATP-binding protein [Stutzerimonas degradans]
MPTSFLEIVELPDGRIVLRRAEDEEVLVTLDFSNDAKLFLQGQHVEIAKAMFNVGVQMAGRISEGEGEIEYEDEPRVLH